MAASSSLSVFDKLKKILDEDTAKKVSDIIASPLQSNSDSYAATWDLIGKEGNLLNRWTNQPCYASARFIFSNTYQKYEAKNARYLVAKVSVGKVRSPVNAAQITEALAIRWIELCVRNGVMLDTMQQPEEIFHRGYKVDLLRPDVNGQRLYVALCCIRNLREQMNLAYQVTRLVNAGIPFWNAFMYIQGSTQSYGGHHWMPWGASRYTTSVNISYKEKQNIYFLYWIRKFLEEETVKNNKPLSHYYLTKSGWCWATQRSVNSPKQVYLLDPIQILGTKVHHISNPETKEEEVKNPYV